MSVQDPPAPTDDSDDPTDPPRGVGVARPAEGRTPSPLVDDDDRTLFAALPGGAFEDTDDRTLFAALPAGASGDADDRTLIQPIPAALRTDGEPPRSAPVGPPEPGDDKTLLARSGDPAGAVESHGPFSDNGFQADDADKVLPGETAVGAAPAAGIQAAPTTVVPPPMIRHTLEPGAVINNMYRVERRIDHGGMGRVFRGVEIGTGEPVAIKVILPEMAEDPRVAQMFRREARTLRQLHHDAIVRYFAYVPPDANFNLHALVMGFIEGTKLSDKIKSDGAMTEAQVCQLFLRLAGGLERAHEIGVIHRDLSPDNVMLPDGDISRALLIDFGISRSSMLKDVTIGNEFAGKLKYVSPEQLGAYGGEAEASSDVYSFALLMNVALTGNVMPMGDSISDAVQKRLSVPDLGAVPAKFQTLLYSMLQPDPARRMQSMAEVSEGLRAIQAGDAAPTAVTQTSTPSRAVPGLQAAPRANLTGVGFVTAAPAGLPGRVPLPLPDQSGGLIVKFLAATAISAVLGWGLLYVFGFPGAQGDDPAGVATADAGLARLAGTEPTFLAQALPGDCGFASRRAEGRNAGVIEAMAADPAALAGIGARFAAAFGIEADVIARPVTPEQCAALEFARTFQGTSGPAIELTLNAGSVPRSEGVVGAIHDSGQRQNWLALVAPTGRVFSLMGQLAEPGADQRLFSFRLPSAQPGTYVMIATASQSALVRAGAMVDGVPAADLLPLMVRELAEDGQGAVDIAVVEITR